MEEVEISKVHNVDSRLHEGGGVDGRPDSVKVEFVALTRGMKVV